jgi:hypothetical protein
MPIRCPTAPIPSQLSEDQAPSSSHGSRSMSHTTPDSSAARQLNYDDVGGFAHLGGTPNSQVPETPDGSEIPSPGTQRRRVEMRGAV